MKKNTAFWMRLCAVCLVFVAGFVAGRKTVETKEVVRYMKDDPVSGTVSGLIPIRETVPEIPVLPLRLDTVFVDSIVYVAVRVDTAAIISDYIASREYTPVLFDSPQIGKLSLSATVQYNKLDVLNYEFVPIYKEVTKYRTKVWEPHIGFSYNTFNQAAVTGGLYRINIGFEFQYISDFDRRRKGYGIGFKYKF